jgi:dolichol kinase
MGYFPLDEVKRKGFHVLTLVYMIAYWIFPWAYVISGMAVILFIAIVGETLRLNIPPVNVWILEKLGGVHRKEEANRISGLIWTISGSLLTMYIFPDRHIVFACLLYLALGDSVAALIGKQRGKNKIWNKKTLEGSLACLFVCLVIGFFLLPWKFAILGAFVATLIETIPWPLNDNFWLPLISAAILTQFMYFV